INDYVKDFDAISHGYRIQINNSKDGSHLIHYSCYRSGHPPPRASAAPTRSARIGCPFKLNARYLPLKKAWLLVHTHLGHNHPPDPKVKPRKARKPKSLTILPPEQPPS
ncbi:hypothetical protein DFH28DRAFT_850260, partial [Melampsora americana]